MKALGCDCLVVQGLLLEPRVSEPRVRFWKGGARHQRFRTTFQGNPEFPNPGVLHFLLGGNEALGFSVWAQTVEP